MKRSEAESAVKSRGWLSKQSCGFCDSLLKQAKLRFFLANDFVYRIDEEGGGVYGVAKGAFKVSSLAVDEVSPIGFYTPGAWFGQRPIFELLPNSRIMEFQAVENSVALFVSFQDVQGLISKEQNFLKRFYSITEFNLSGAIRTINDLLIRRADKRIGATLLRMTGCFEGFEPFETRPIHASQKEIAEMSNASRDSVNKTLTAFSLNNWVSTGYNTTRVTDIPALWFFCYDVQLEGAVYPNEP